MCGLFVAGVTIDDGRRVLRDGKIVSKYDRVYRAHMNSKDLIKELTKDGWYLDRVKGSHHVYKHPHRPGHLSISKRIFK